MESNTNSNDYEAIARAICNQNKTNENPTHFNLDMVLQVIDKIEGITGCKLYNKDQLTNQLVELTEENFAAEAKKAIWKNMIPQVDFNTLFKSNMEFSLVFNQDDVVVLYKNKVVGPDNLEEIKSSLIKNNQQNFPLITELYVDNICQVITKFMNKDISVQYYCGNIPVPYWKLFEIKVKKSNTNTKEIHEKCQELEKIVTGQYFQQTKPDVQVVGQDDDELKAVLMQIEEYENKTKNSNGTISTSGLVLTDNEVKALDDVYRMEVMSYLNDNEIMQFLDAIEKLDKMDTNAKYTDKEFIMQYFKFTIECTNTMKNKIAKFYYVFRLYCLINNATWFIEQHEAMRINIANKINEFSEELYVLQSAELKLFHGVVNTMNKTKEFIDTIGKKANPNYVSTWQTNDQQNILNQIITNTTNNINNQNNINNNINNNQTQIILDSDDEIENDDGDDDDEHSDLDHNSDYDSDN